MRLVQRAQICPWASLLRATNAFRVTWPLSLVVSDTSPKCIDREGLGRRRTGTRQGFINKRMLAFEKASVTRALKARLTSPEVWAAQLQRFDMIHTKPPFLFLNQEEDKRKFCSLGGGN